MATVLLLLAAHSALPVHASSSYGPTGRTLKNGGAGCSTSCHVPNPTQRGTVTISGPSSLAPGAAATYTVTYSSVEDSGRNMGLNVAVSDASIQLSVSSANTYIDTSISVGELAHTQAEGVLATTNGSGVASYSFTYTMPSEAASGSIHTMYATARIHASWNHAANFAITANASSTIDQASLTTLFKGSSAPGPIAFGSSGTLSTSGGSGTGAVSYSSDSAACSIVGTTLTAAAVGSCTITATKAGDATYNPASDTLSITIEKASQVTLTATASPGSIEVGATSTLATSGGSGTGAVSFASNSASCSIASNVLTGVSAGTCTVTATKAGDAQYTAASDSLLLVIQKAAQAPLTVIASAPNVQPGGTLTLGTTGGSGTGIVSFASSNAHCSISGVVLTGVTAGSCVVTGTKAEDAKFRAASDTLEIVVGAPMVTRRAYLVNPGRMSAQSLLRFINPMDGQVEIAIEARDDTGSVAPALTLTLAPGASTMLTSQELEGGAPAKGLAGQLGTGLGRWQLEARANTRFELLALIRTGDLLSNVSDVAPSPGARIAFARPASSAGSTTQLRIVNPDDAAGRFTISGIDDAGRAAPGGSAAIDLEAHTATLLSSADLEGGSPGSGLLGALGDGAGSWRLAVRTGGGRVRAISLLRSNDGLVTALSRTAPILSDGRHFVAYALAAESSGPQSQLRLTNRSNETGALLIRGIDAAGVLAPPGGPVRISLGARRSTLLTLADLENGNTAKGLVGALGDGSGDWQLTVDGVGKLIEVMHQVRTADGFLTEVNATAPKASGTIDIWLFNPATATAQRSLLRLVNRSNAAGTVTISAIDDTGAPAPGGAVTVAMVARGSRTLSAVDLEQGNPARGVSGALGDGTGRWRLSLSSALDMRAFSLVKTPAGNITNVSVPASD